MRKIYNKLTILILVVLNYLVMMTGCIAGAGNITITTSNNNTNIENRLEEIKQRGALIVASSNEKPFSYIDPQTGNFTGIDVDILTEAAKRLGIDKVKMKLTPFKYIIEDLNNKDNVDIIATGLYVTDERKKEVLFTNVWYKQPETILLLKSSPFNSKDL